MSWKARRQQGNEARDPSRARPPFTSRSGVRTFSRFAFVLRYSTFAILSLCVTVNAQSGADYVIAKSSIAAGGHSGLSGGDYLLSGGVSQRSAALSGGDYTATGGFWSSASASASGMMQPCRNDFVDATGGAGGERLSRFLCLAAPEPPAAAGGVSTALRVVLKTVYNTTEGDPDGAMVCPAIGRTKPGLDQFEGDTRWVGAPRSEVDDALPQPPGYIVAPLVCNGAETAARDWSPSALAAEFPSADSTQVYLFGPEIVPCSVYEVSQCSDPLDEATCSAPMLILTSVLGDCWPRFGSTQEQPGFSDVGATVAKFKSLPFNPGPTPAGGPPEWHVLIKGNYVLPVPPVGITKADFIDIGKIINSFKRLAYNEDGPCDPDTGLDNCGNVCDTTPSN